jgi:hypothetical protein
MRIPLHWSKATAEESDQNGKKTSFSCWRSSDVSPEEAQRSALAAAKRALRKLAINEQSGRYPYGDAPLREEVVQRFEDSRGSLYAAVTRNGYGSLVLNAARAMFIDIDFPDPLGISPWESLKMLFARLFGKSPPSADSLQEEAQGRLERFVSEHGGWGMRIYRTRAGVRGLVTHDLFDPAADGTLSLLQSAGADPLYVRLCKAQECFRARLTPKPWRCGHFVNRTVWPRDDAEQQQRFEQWLAAYMSSQSQYATCRYLGTLGNSAVHPEIETIIEVHDEITRCHDVLELA